MFWASEEPIEHGNVVEIDDAGAGQRDDRGSRCSQVGLAKGGVSLAWEEKQTRPCEH